LKKEGGGRERDREREEEKVEMGRMIRIWQRRIGTTRSTATE